MPLDIQDDYPYLLERESGLAGTVYSGVSPSLRYNYLFDKDEFERTVGVPLEGDVNSADIKKLRDYYYSSPLGSYALNKIEHSPSELGGNTVAFYEPSTGRIVVDATTVDYFTFRHETTHSIHKHLKDTNPDFEGEWDLVARSSWGNGVFKHEEFGTIWADYYGEPDELIEQLDPTITSGPRYGFVNSLWANIVTCEQM